MHRLTNYERERLNNVSWTESCCIPGIGCIDIVESGEVDAGVRLKDVLETEGRVTVREVPSEPVKSPEVKAGFIDRFKESNVHERSICLSLLGEQSIPSIERTPFVLSQTRSKRKQTLN